VIARALALSPKVIICDEMVSALDVSVQAQILNLMNSLKADRELTYIFISHDLSVVKYMSNRMLVMQQGRLVEYGYSENVYTNPQSDYTKKLIESIPGLTS
jgi:peptide/nickel transport system ATP-binding protein